MADDVDCVSLRDRLRERIELSKTIELRRQRLLASRFERRRAADEMDGRSGQLLVQRAHPCVDERGSIVTRDAGDQRRGPDALADPLERRGAARRQNAVCEREADAFGRTQQLPGPDRDDARVERLIHLPTSGHIVRGETGASDECRRIARQRIAQAADEELAVHAPGRDDDDARFGAEGVEIGVSLRACGDGEEHPDAERCDNDRRNDPQRGRNAFLSGPVPGLEQAFERWPDIFKRGRVA